MQSSNGEALSPGGSRIDGMDDLLRSLLACSPSELQAPGTGKQGPRVKEMLFAPVQSGAQLVKGENTLEKSGNGLKFSHFPSVLYPGSMCWGCRGSDFINRVCGGRKLTPCELFSSPCFAHILQISFLLSLSGFSPPCLWHCKILAGPGARFIWVE